MNHERGELALANYLDQYKMPESWTDFPIVHKYESQLNLHEILRAIESPTEEDNYWHVLPIVGNFQLVEDREDVSFQFKHYDEPTFKSLEDFEEEDFLKLLTALLEASIDLHSESNVSSIQSQILFWHENNAPLLYLAIRRMKYLGFSEEKIARRLKITIDKVNGVLIRKTLEN
ncbi:MAG: hypothetical protein JXR10_06780 [Cyclobacteriaceae bacterium]